MAAVVVLAVACGRNAEGQAAVRAQDACITALEPAAQHRLPTGDEIGAALRHAEAAAEVDERWLALRQRVQELAAVLQRGDDADDAVQQLADECRRVNDIVRERQRANT